MPQIRAHEGATHEYEVLEREGRYITQSDGLILLVDPLQIESVRDDLDRGVVRVEVDIPIAWCASVHADDAEAEGTVAAAANQIDAADLGDPAAEEAVDDAEGFELSWYATQEIADLLSELS